MAHLPRERTATDDSIVDSILDMEIPPSSSGTYKLSNAADSAMTQNLFAPDGTYAPIPEQTKPRRLRITKQRFQTLFYLLLALISHTFWGLYPGLSRYLQTEVGLGAFLLLAGGFVGASVVMGPPLFLYYGYKTMFSMKRLWVFIVLCLALEYPLVYAVRLTLSIYVQTILLSVPFIGAYFSKLVFTRELPPHTIKAIFLSLVGAFLVLAGELMDPSVPDSDFRGRDGLGCILALISAISLSAYYVFVQTVPDSVPTEIITWIMLTVTGLVSLPLSYFIDDWNVVYELDVYDWIVWLCFSLVVFVLGNFFAVLAVRHLSAALVGTLLPWRLVVAFVFSASPFLHEPLGVLNYIGLGIVILTLGTYLHLTYTYKARKLQFIIIRNHDSEFKPIV